MDTPFLVAIFAALPLLLLFLYFRCSSSYQVLKRHGIKGPTPSFFFGHYLERRKQGGLLEYSKKLHQEYGPIVGMYVGKEYQISVTDMELIKQVTVKDFDHFTDRPALPDVLRLPNGLLLARGETWKRQRQILSPTFSSFKMKALMHIIQRSVQTLVEVFHGHASQGKTTEILKMYGSFTMETILASAFGRVIEIQKGESNELTEAAAAFFEAGDERNLTSVVFLTTFLSNFPWLIPVLKLLLKGSSRDKAYSVLTETAAAVICERRKEKSKQQDLLQLMIDASVDDGEGGGRKTLSDEHIIGNALTIMLAGYDTTGNALTYTSYLLALNPHVQERLQQEIDEYYEENPEVSPYQAAQDLEYLDMVLQESLRLYPPAPVFTRDCVKAYAYKDITIPRGCMVLIPNFLLHMNPEYWKDPETFDPLRFTAEEKAKRPQLAHIPFGHGPRSCIGMRFALLEAKMALIEVLKRFSFVQTPETEVPLERAFGITMSPKNGIYLKIVTRTRREQ